MARKMRPSDLRHGLYELHAYSATGLRYVGKGTQHEVVRLYNAYSAKERDTLKITHKDAIQGEENNTMTDKKTSTKKTATKKATTKKATAKKAPVATKAKEKEQENGNGNSAVSKLRETIVKSYPNVPSVDALVKSSGMTEGRVSMYRGAILRTMKTVEKVGRLK